MLLVHQEGIVVAMCFFAVQRQTRCLVNTFSVVSISILIKRCRKIKFLKYWIVYKMTSDKVVQFTCKFNYSLIYYILQNFYLFIFNLSEKHKFINQNVYYSSSKFLYRRISLFNVENKIFLNWYFRHVTIRRLWRGKKIIKKMKNRLITSLKERWICSI